MPGPAIARALRPAVLGLAAWLVHAAALPGLAAEKITTVAVFPVENLAGTAAPVADVRQSLIARLASSGIAVLRKEALDEFMARHRVRYGAGIDSGTAELLRRETGVDAVLFASLERATPTAPPKVALVARLVSVAAAPAVVWSDDVGMAGDDAPGFFELGVVSDYEVLFARAIDRIASSLVRFVAQGKPPAGAGKSSKFRPKTSFRALELEPGRRYSVAVVPFVNLSARRNAGEILALLFMRHLSGLAPFEVVERGVTTRQLLDARIIMEGGLAVSDAETVAALVDADLVLGGRVLRYEDYEGGGGRARVEFSTVLIERKSRRVVWSSDSYNEGTDGVRMFERGTVRTAHAMATQMVEIASGMIAGAGR